MAQTALLLPNGPEMIYSMLGSLKAHKAYVPVDAHFPKDRLRAMIAHCQPVVLLTDGAHLELAAELADRRIPIINTDAIRFREDKRKPGIPCRPLDRAYILYTSGTTGTPKGIEFLHRNLLHTTMCLTNELYYSASDRVTWLHFPTFGSSVVDIYCCLMNGGTLLPWDVRAQGLTGMCGWLVSEKATTFQWIPSAFRQFARTIPEGVRLGGIRIVVMAGEPLTSTEVDLFRRHFAPGSHLVNQVGTAESYNYYLYRVDHQIGIEGASVPGGYPVSEDRQLLILGEDGAELPRGTVGEIAIRSDYMAAGYWRDKVQTRARFVRLGGDPRPVYLTGDLGRIEPDGCLTHLGRKDHQLKLRGCRIEVAEIEHRLRACPGIADAAVWVAKNRLGEDQLVAYVVPEGAARLDRDAVAAQLGAALPDYMVPGHFVAMEELPSLPTGKVNRQGLPNPFAAGGRTSPFERSAPNSIEREIIGFFRELLKTEDVDTNTDFMRQGGDSLLAAVLASKISERFRVEFGPADCAPPISPNRLARAVAGKLSLQGETVRTDSAEGSGEAGTPEPAGRAPALIGLEANGGAGAVKDLVIIGAGEAAREIFTWASQAIAAGARLRLKGFLDTRPGVLDGYRYEVGIIGTPDDYQIGENDVFVGGLGDPRDKIRFYSPVARRGGRFVNLVHPLANVGGNVYGGTGIVLAPFASVTSDVRIGDHVSIGAFSNVAHDTVVGEWCQICSHCGLNGRAELGTGVFLGSHACVIPGVKVGAWAYVGAGSIVVRNVPPEAKVFGNPAAEIGRARRGTSEARRPGSRT